MKIHIIVAMTKKGVIGVKGRVPWDLPKERKLFKKLTLGKTVMMGKNTWDSLPRKNRPLLGRNNIVISASLRKIKGAIVCRTIAKALAKAKEYNKDIYCIGGAQLYNLFLPAAEVLHISWVEKDFEGDVFFHKFDLGQWACIKTIEQTGFTYKKYTRKTIKRFKGGE